MHEKLEEMKRQVANLERLLEGVLSDRVEAVKEGWPEAREKYDWLEAQVREQLDKARDLLRRIESAGA